VIDEVSVQLEKKIDKKLVLALVRHYRKIKENYLMSRFEPTELNGGKFSEIVIRILQNLTNEDKSYTPLGNRLGNYFELARSFEQLPRTHNDSLRLHIPRVVQAVYNIRNHRSVGHIGGDVDPNISDANFITAACDWIMSEFVRLFYDCSLEEAQTIVNNLAQRKASPIYILPDGRRRILNPRLTYKEKTLLLLFNESKRVLDKDLFAWTEHSNISKFKQAVLLPLHKDALIDWHNGTCEILPPGEEQVAEKYPDWPN